MADGDTGVPGLAARLNRLFDTVPSPGGGRWTNDQVAQLITQAGTTLTSGYLSQLRIGARDNPSARHLAAIAQFFGVTVDYFFDDELAAKLAADLAELAALRDEGVAPVVKRLHGLSAAALSSLEGIVDQVRNLEGLPPIED